MTDTHPHTELEPALARFARGEATAEERHTVLRHLIEGCADCSSSLDRQLRPAVEEDALDAAVDRAVAKARVLARQLEDHRDQAAALLVSLEAEAPAERESTLADLDEALLRTVVEMALARCHELRHQDATRNLQLAQLAVVATRHLSSKDHRTLEARALAEQANAHRVCGDLHEARRGLSQAGELNVQAGDDPAVRADILAYRASLAMDQRHPEEALAHLQQALTIYTRLGDENGAIEALIRLALVHEKRGTPRDGLQYLMEVMERLQTQPDARMEAIAIHDLIHLTLLAGDVEEAARLLEDSRSILESTNDRLIRLRLNWLSARVADAQGRHDEAIASLEVLRRTFSELDMPYEEALVSLDLAALYAAVGERSQQRELAQCAGEVFQALSIGPEALATLALLAKAEAEEAVKLVAHLNLVMENARHRLN